MRISAARKSAIRTGAYRARHTTAFSRLLLLAIFAAAAAAADPCGKVDSPFRIAHPFGPVISLNPAAPGASFPVLDRLYEPLVRVRPSGEEPALAESWTSEPTSDGGQVITFSLAKAKWHDSKKVSAKDVAFTVPLITELAFNNNAGFYLLTGDVAFTFNDVEVVDKDKVKIYLTDPSYFAFRDVAATKVLPEHVWGSFESSDDLIAFDNAAPVGTGPFTYNDEISTADIQYLSNYKKYWNGCSNLKEIRIISDDGTVSPVQQVSADTVDLWVGFSANQDLVDEASVDPNVGTSLNARLGFRYLAFNFRRQPMASSAFRAAFAHLIDRAAVLSSLGVADITQPESRLVLDDYGPWQNPNVVTRAYNPELARQLLETAGYFDVSGNYVGDVIEILVPESDPIRVGFADAIAAEARAIGLPVEVDATSFAEIIERIFIDDDNPEFPDFDMLILGWGVGSDVRYLYDFFVSDSPLNIPGIYERSLDAALNALRSATNKEDAITAAHEAQAILASELPYLVLYRGKIESYYDVSFDSYQVPDGEFTLLNNETLLELNEQ